MRQRALEWFVSSRRRVDWWWCVRWMDGILVDDITECTNAHNSKDIATTCVYIRKKNNVKLALRPDTQCIRDALIYAKTYSIYVFYHAQFLSRPLLVHNVFVLYILLRLSRTASVAVAHHIQQKVFFNEQSKYFCLYGVVCTPHDDPAHIKTILDTASGMYR